jgi:hypothetical protein
MTAVVVIVALFNMDSRQEENCSELLTFVFEEMPTPRTFQARLLVVSFVRSCVSGVIRSFDLQIKKEIEPEG